jgi:multiple sugar transport system permease protein
LNGEKMARRSLRSRRGPRSERLWGPLYVLPALGIVLIFIGYPFAELVYHAFTNWNGFVPANWIGVHNFINLFHDPLFRLALRNNVIFAAMVPIQLTVPMVLAYLLYCRIPGWRIFRATFFLPAVYSTVVIGLLSQSIFSVTGAFNGLLSAVGLRFLEHNWLLYPVTSIPTILLIVIWANFGYNVLIYLGGMGTLAPEMIDAAKIDGVRFDRMLTRVIAPNLKGAMELVLVTSTITAFAYMFTYIYVITNGGPGFDTYVVELLVYNDAFVNRALGYASAMGLVLIAVTSTIGFFQVRMLTGRGRGHAQ